MNTQGPLDDLLVVSDMDNTLLTETDGLPAQNLQALRRFCALGGHFTVATGRNVPSAARHLQQLPVNAPAILLNGGLLYDYASGQTLAARYLAREKALPVLLMLQKQFPAMGFEVMTEDLQTYIVQNGPAVERHLQQEQFCAILADAEKLPGGWFKVLAAGTPAQCAAAEKYCRRQFATEKQLVFQRTQDCYFEVLPAGIDKGTALQSLCSLQGILPQNTFALGDYDNDIALFDAAGLGVAVANAPARVRRRADLVTGSCQAGGVAQFLWTLMRRRLGEQAV